MKPTKILIWLLTFLVCLPTIAQKKSIDATLTTEKIVIDGKFNEAAWAAAPIATNFIMFSPDNGKPISKEKNTEVKVLYDNDAIYISATMYDDNPSKILREITQRDNIGAQDIFGVFVNGFNDSQQDFQFFVSASGVQIDKLALEDGFVDPENYNQNFTWDAIWDSEVRITNFGWTAEIKIPYAALRFSDAKIQTWGINFYRNITRENQSFTWNPIYKNIKSTRTQNGLLNGLQNIKTPTRLFFIPYTSYYYEKNQDGSENKFKGGLDLKYGINDSFTVDAILVPDFGQTKFDNVIKNLGPYEQVFSENRAFFTEGANLFGRGGMFYSRRIGGAPKFVEQSYDAQSEEVIDQPATVNMLNATKLSGRTKGGLGIGILNAVTETTYSNIKNKTTGEIRKSVIEPLTNYNVLVLDQRFKQNSVSLVNTNVSRAGHFQDANATGLMYNLNNKNNSYNLYGDFKYSYINGIIPVDGYKTAINIEKTSGQNRFWAYAKYVSDGFDINDLGYSNQNNFQNYYAEYTYMILNSTKVFNTFQFSFKSDLELQNDTNKIQANTLVASVLATTLRNDFCQAELLVNPKESFDFYQPHTEGRFSYVPRAASGLLLYSSNYNFPFAIDFKVIAKVYDEEKRIEYVTYFSPRYRANDRLLLVYTLDWNRYMNDRGWIGNDGNDIYYVQRDVKTVSNEFSGKYAINNKSTINLSVRHYWLTTLNSHFFTLNQNGYLDKTTFVDDLNDNFNAWNFDLSYSWWFASASQISILYRNNAINYKNNVDKDFGNNLKNLFDTNLNNIFSISCRYYIDYNTIKNKF